MLNCKLVKRLVSFALQLQHLTILALNVASSFSAQDTASIATQLEAKILILI